MLPFGYTLWYGMVPVYVAGCHKFCIVRSDPIRYDIRYNRKTEDPFLLLLPHPYSLIPTLLMVALCMVGCFVFSSIFDSDYCYGFCLQYNSTTVQQYSTRIESGTGHLRHGTIYNVFPLFFLFVLLFFSYISGGWGVGGGVKDETNEQTKCETKNLLSSSFFLSILFLFYFVLFLVFFFFSLIQHSFSLTYRLLIIDGIQ